MPRTPEVSGPVGTSSSGAPTSPTPPEQLVRGYSAAGIAIQGNTNTGVAVEGVGGQGPGVLGRSNSGDGVQGTTRSPNHAGVSAINDVGGYGLWARASGPNPAGHFEGDVHVTGTLTADKDVVLSNADCAEDFDVAVATIAPGTVVRLDDSGVLHEADVPYDRRVAGVISGAGDYKPGLILDKQRFVKGRMPLALVGKVFCKVDADLGSVEVGDLLTTSSTPGHAMKAAEPQRAFGAVIGKALRRLPRGRGLIPILVALQ